MKGLSLPSLVEEEKPVEESVHLEKDISKKLSEVPPTT